MAPKNQGSKSHSSSFLSRVPTAHGRRSLDTLQDAPYMSSLAIPLASDAQLTSDDELDTPRLWTKASPLVDDSPGGQQWGELSADRLQAADVADAHSATSGSATHQHSTRRLSFDSPEGRQASMQSWLQSSAGSSAAGDPQEKQTSPFMTQESDQTHRSHDSPALQASPLMSQQDGPAVGIRDSHDPAMQFSPQLLQPVGQALCGHDRSGVCAEADAASPAAASGGSSSRAGPAADGKSSAEQNMQHHAAMFGATAALQWDSHGQRFMEQDMQHPAARLSVTAALAEEQHHTLGNAAGETGGTPLLRINTSHVRQPLQDVNARYSSPEQRPYTSKAAQGHSQPGSSPERSSAESKLPQGSEGTVKTLPVTRQLQLSSFKHSAPHERAEGHGHPQQGNIPRSAERVDAQPRSRPAAHDSTESFQLRHQASVDQADSHPHEEQVRRKPDQSDDQPQSGPAARDSTDSLELQLSQMHKGPLTSQATACEPQPLLKPASTAMRWLTQLPHSPASQYGTPIGDLASPASRYSTPRSRLAGSPNPNHNPPPFGSLPDIQALWSSARKAASGQMHCRSHSVTGAVPGASEAAVAATRDDRLAAVRQLRFASRSEREAADVAVRHVQTDRASLEEGLQSAVLRAQQVAAEQQRVLAELEAAQEALHDADVRCQTLEAQLQAEVGKREALEAQNRAAADELSEERRKRTSLLGTLEFIKHKALRVSPLEIADQQRDSHAAGSGSRPGSQRQHAMRHSVDSMPSTRLRQLRSQRQGVDLPLSQQQPEPNAQLVFRHSVNGPLLPQPSSATAVHANAVGSHSWANSKLNADPSSQEDQPPEMAATPDVLRHSVHSMSNSTGTWPALIPSASPMICGEPIGDAPKPQDVTDAGGASCGQNPDNRELSTEPSVASAAWPAYDAVYNNVGTADLASSVALKSAHTTAIAGTVASHTASGLPGPAHNAQASLGSEQAHPESSVAANQPLPAVQATVGNQQNYQQSTAAATQELSTSHGSNDLDREEQARQPDSSYNVELLQALAACEELLRAEQEENDELHRQVQRAEREQAALLDRVDRLEDCLTLKHQQRADACVGPDGVPALHDAVGPLVPSADSSGAHAELLGNHADDVREPSSPTALGTLSLEPLLGSMLERGHLTAELSAAAAALELRGAATAAAQRMRASEQRIAELEARLADTSQRLAAAQAELSVHSRHASDAPAAQQVGEDSAMESLVVTSKRGAQQPEACTRAVCQANDSSGAASQGPHAAEAGILQSNPCSTAPADHAEAAEAGILQSNPCSTAPADHAEAAEAGIFPLATCPTEPADNAGVCDVGMAGRDIMQQLQGLQSQLVAAVGRADSSEAMCTSLAEELERWDQYPAQIAALHDLLAAQASELEELRVEVVQLTEARDAAQAHAGSTQEDLAQMQRHLRQADEGCVEAEMHAATLQNQLDAALADQRALQACLDAVRAEPETHAATLESQLEAALADQRGLQARLDAAESTGAVLQLELDAALQQLQQTRADGEESLHANEATLAEANEKLVTEIARSVKFAQLLADAEQCAELAASTRSALQADLAAAQDQAHLSAQQMAELESQLAAAQEQARLADQAAEHAQQQLSALQQHTEPLQVQLTSLECKATGLEEALESATKAKSELQDQMTDLQSRATCAQEAQAAAESRAGAVQLELSLAVKARASAERQVASLQLQLQTAAHNAKVGLQRELDLQQQLAQFRGQGGSPGHSRSQGEGLGTPSLGEQEHTSSECPPTEVQPASEKPPTTPQRATKPQRGCGSPLGLAGPASPLAVGNPLSLRQLSALKAQQSALHRAQDELQQALAELHRANAHAEALNQRCQTAAEAREHAEFLLAEATCRADAASAELAAAQSRIQQLEAELADASAAASDGGAAGVASSAEEPAAVCMGNRCEVVQLPSPRQAEGVVSPGHIGELWVQLSKTRAQTDQLIRSKSLSERKVEALQSILESTKASQLPQHGQQAQQSLSEGKVEALQSILESTRASQLAQHRQQAQQADMLRSDEGTSPSGTCLPEGQVPEHAMSAEAVSNAAPAAGNVLERVLHPHDACLQVWSGNGGLQPRTQSVGPQLCSEKHEAAAAFGLIADASSQSDPGSRACGHAVHAVHDRHAGVARHEASTQSNPGSPGCAHAVHDRHAVDDRHDASGPVGPDAVHRVHDGSGQGLQRLAASCTQPHSTSACEPPATRAAWGAATGTAAADHCPAQRPSEGEPASLSGTPADKSTRPQSSPGQLCGVLTTAISSRLHAQMGAHSAALQRWLQASLPPQVRTLLMLLLRTGGSGILGLAWWLVVARMQSSGMKYLVQLLRLGSRLQQRRLI